MDIKFFINSKFRTILYVSSILIFTAICMIVANEKRGYFAIGGEVLIPFVFLLLHIVHKCAKEDNEE